MEKELLVAAETTIRLLFRSGSVQEDAIMNRSHSWVSNQPVSGSHLSTGMSELRFTELFDLQEIQSVQDALAEAAAAASIIVDPDGRPITRPSNICRLCAQVRRNNPQALATCMRPRHIPNAGVSSGPLLYRCPNGLLTGCIAIRVFDRHLADWILGQVLDEPPDEERMLARARKFGADEKQFRAALAEVPVIPKDQFEKTCFAVYTVARHLSALAARNLEQARHIDDMRQTQDEFRRQQAYFEQLFEKSPQGIVLLDNNDRIIDVNKGFERIFQYQAEEIKGRPLNDVIIPENLYDEATALSQTVIGGEVIERESVRKRKDGSLVDVSILGYPIVVEGEQIGVYGIYNDITERKQAEDRLRYVSLHDSLTGLYNRAYFEEEMRRLGSARYAPVSIIVCDVDGLKLVNDALGHEVGDTLLLAAAQVISKSFREGDVVARIGGDEFAVLLPNCPYSAAKAACGKIRTNIERYNAEHGDLPLSISIGCASGDGSKGMSALFKEADNEMYREKLQRGRSTRSAIVQALIKSYEARDFVADGHVERLERLVSELGRTIGLSEEHIADLCLLARFHDIGKVGIPDRILFKPGPLTPDEWREMQRHCEIGHRIALSSPELAPIADWILKHQEWWDGTGYPLGLKGEDICLVCRILSIADAYDAMTHDRPYRKAMSHEEAVAELRRYAGIQFDPELVPKFIDIIEKWRTQE